MARKRQNIRVRPDGKAYTAYLRLHGKQVMKSFPKTEIGLDDAELWLEQKRAEKRRGGREPSRMLFADYAADWLDKQQRRGKIRPRTCVLYEQRLRSHLNPVLGDLLLTEIRRDHVWQVLERAEGLSGWTRKGILNLLSGILRHAVDEEEIPRNVVATFSTDDRPKSKEGGKGRKRILSADELRALLVASGEKYKPLFRGGGVRRFASVRGARPCVGGS